jgi:hypothetical protein
MRVQRFAQVLHREIRGVDDLVGARTQIHEHEALLVDRRLNAAGRLERMAMARLAIAAQQDLV